MNPQRYRPDPGETVAVAQHSGEHIFVRDGQEIGVTLIARRPTILRTWIAHELAPDGVQISRKSEGEMWRRMRLIQDDTRKVDA